MCGFQIYYQYIYINWIIQYSGFITLVQYYIVSWSNFYKFALSSSSMSISDFRFSSPRSPSTRFALIKAMTHNNRPPIPDRVNHEKSSLRIRDIEKIANFFGTARHVSPRSQPQESAKSSSRQSVQTSRLRNDAWKSDRGSPIVRRIFFLSSRKFVSLQIEFPLLVEKKKDLWKYITLRDFVNGK